MDNESVANELKTIYIKRGESMDTESLEKLKKATEAYDIQIIIEIVDSSYLSHSDGVIYIEEGVIVPAKGVEK